MHQRSRGPEAVTGFLRFFGDTRQPFFQGQSGVDNATVARKPFLRATGLLESRAERDKNSGILLRR